MKRKHLGGLLVLGLSAVLLSSCRIPGFNFSFGNPFARDPIPNGNSVGTRDGNSVHSVRLYVEYSLWLTVSVNDGDILGPHQTPYRSGYTFDHWVDMDTGENFSLYTPIYRDYNLEAYYLKGGSASSNTATSSASSTNALSADASYSQISEFTSLLNEHPQNYSVELITLQNGDLYYAGGSFYHNENYIAFVNVEDPSGTVAVYGYSSVYVCKDINGNSYRGSFDSEGNLTDKDTFWGDYDDLGVAQPQTLSASDFSYSSSVGGYMTSFDTMDYFFETAAEYSISSYYSYGYMYAVMGFASYDVCDQMIFGLNLDGQNPNIYLYVYDVGRTSIPVIEEAYEF